MAVTAGVVEEIVVLGFLVRRLEQGGHSPAVVVTVAVVVRISYHLYYGWGSAAGPRLGAGERCRVPAIPEALAVHRGALAMGHRPVARAVFRQSSAGLRVHRARTFDLRVMGAVARSARWRPSVRPAASGRVPAEMPGVRSGPQSSWGAGVAPALAESSIG